MKKYFFLGMLTLLPLAANAQSGGFCDNGNNIRTISDIFWWLTCLLNRAVLPFLMTLAVVLFIYGVVQYILHSDNEEERKKGKEFMIYGIISLFVMVSVWGLVAVLGNTFGVSNVIPQLPTR